MDNEKIGYNIKKIRKLKKLTQQELANKIGKTESTIRKYENGSIEIPLSVLDSIAEVFNINPLSLLEYDYYKDHINNKEDAIEYFFNIFGVNLQKLDTLLDGSGEHEGFSKLTYKDKEYIARTFELYDKLFNDIKDYVLFKLEKLLENNDSHDAKQNI